MGRKVSVSLEADISKFVAPVEASKKAVDDLGDKVDKLDRELDKIPPDAAKAAAAMKLLSGEADAAGQKIGSVAEKGTKLSALDAKIRETRSEVRKLADEFVKTGDVDVFRRLGDSQGRLSSLLKIRKSVSESIEDGAKDAAASPELGQVAQKIGMVIAAGMAVPLVAAAGGAVLGGVGFGVAGLGLLGAVLGDPDRFGYAWSQQLRVLKTEFLNATEPFQHELYGVIAGIGPLVQSWHLDEVFRNAVKYVQPLARGVEGFATHIVSGISALVDKGEPAVNALSQSMDRLGLASERAMNSISDGAEGGAYALHDVANAVSLAIEGFGVLIEGAERFYAFTRDHPVEAGFLTLGLSTPLSAFSHTVGEADGLTRSLTTTTHGLEEAAKAAGHAFNAQGDDLSALSQQLNSAMLSTDSLAGAMTNKLFTALMNVDQATLGVNRSLITVGETFEQNGRQIDKHTGLVADNTKKGIDNREAVLAAVEANMRLYQSNISVGMSAEDAAAQYDENTKKLEDQLRAAHLTQGQIDDLIGTYRDIPDTVNTTIAIQGLTEAINNLDHTLRLMAGLKDKDVYVRVHNQVFNETTGRRMTGNSRLGEDTSEYGRIRYRAAEGMIVPPSSPGTMLFGEPTTGGEAFIPLKGISPTRAMGLAQIVGNNYGFSVGPSMGAGITVTLIGGDPLTQAMLTSIRYEVRTGFGGNVQVALGR